MTLEMQMDGREKGRDLPELRSPNKGSCSLVVLARFNPGTWQLQEPGSTSHPEPHSAVAQDKERAQRRHRERTRQQRFYSGSEKKASKEGSAI